MQNLNTWKFGIQVFFSLIVMGLCVVKLADNKTPPEQQALYWGGLTGILGYWLPSPTHNREEQELTLTTGSIISRSNASSQNNGSGTIAHGVVARATTDQSQE